MLRSKKTSNYRQLSYEGNGPLIQHTLSSDWEKKESLTSFKDHTSFGAQLLEGTVDRTKAALEDKVRIAKFLATPGGIKWQVHQEALQKLQSELESKREVSSISNGVLKTIKRVASGVVNLDTDLLNQIIANGSGNHLEGYKAKSSYVQTVGGVFDRLETRYANVVVDPVSGNVVKGRKVSNNQINTRFRRLQSQPSDINNVQEGNAEVKFQHEESSIDKLLEARTKLYEDKEYIKVHEKASKDLELQAESFISEAHKVSEPLYSDPNNTPLSKFEKTSGNISEYKSETENNQYSSVKDYRYRSSDHDNLRTDIVKISRSGRKWKDPLTVNSVDDELEFVHSGYEDSINLIPFEIHIINPVGNSRTKLYFQANIDSYSDSFTGNWGNVNYVGRAEKFYTYEGFDRKISFGFTVAANNEDELEPIYRNLNRLTGATAPGYVNGLFMRGTYAMVTIGDLLNKQYGVFTSVDLNWETDYLWEIRDGYLKVPTMLGVKVSFTPIQTQNVTFDTPFFGIK